MPFRTDIACTQVPVKWVEPLYYFYPGAASVNKTGLVPSCTSKVLKYCIACTAGPGQVGGALPPGAAVQHFQGRAVAVGRHPGQPLPAPARCGVGCGGVTLV